MSGIQNVGLCCTVLYCAVLCCTVLYGIGLRYLWNSGGAGHKTLELGREPGIQLPLHEVEGADDSRLAIMTRMPYCTVSNNTDLYRPLPLSRALGRCRALGSESGA
ncbi:hypothetical protein EX30DRAFT_343396 [Ascodesmis nigricans]|uniref:Uncharacterized protein n=1 Tax=Ascodesmis nigricans TaxID=341454 RepID=A0A4S2MM82_9PEZI|nr:hypothetical protein EX30DRAFT_343396 [Ascodesmis nigricans]